ncbi:MAG TPA: hypothetical protein VK302_06190 [Terriglobales bacterium]|nr:hypothetical protein [Terriglobales bacterium]
MRRLTGHDEGEINRILSREDEILPSSGFAVSVMDAVRREAAAPPPIPFPWKRALPGLVVGGFVLAMVFVTVVAVSVQLIRSATSGHFSISLPPWLTPILGLQRNLEIAAGWTVLALLVTFVSVKLSMRLGSRRA